MKAPAASAPLARLNPFVGAWDTTGNILVNASPATFKAADTYEWLSGGHFLIHRFDANMPDGRVQGIEIIGYDRESTSYPMYSFDSAGNATLMHARIENDTWTFEGEHARFVGGFREDGKVFAGRWELRSGDAWQPWMDITLRRVE